jgi:hypothetical protein
MHQSTQRHYDDHPLPLAMVVVVADAYSVEFSEALIAQAKVTRARAATSFEYCRATLHSARLSIEISLKSLLQGAGLKPQEIRKHNHDLKRLLESVCRCRIPAPSSAGSRRRLNPASALRAVVVDERFANATVGTMLGEMSGKVSVYPNETRYAESLQDFQLDLVVALAEKVYKWAHEHADKIREPLRSQ